MNDEEHDALMALRRQLEDLSARIDKINDRVQESGKKADKTYSDLYEKQPGDLTDEKPLLEAMRVLVRTMNRSKWAARALTWIATAFAAAATLYIQLVRSGR